MCILRKVVLLPTARRVWTLYKKIENRENLKHLILREQVRSVTPVYLFLRKIMDIFMTHPNQCILIWTSFE